MFNWIACVKLQYLKTVNCVKTSVLRLVEKCYPQKCSETVYMIYIYKMDLALNNQQGLICFKTKPNQTDCITANKGKNR